MKKYIMSLDAGTTGNRCIIYNEKAEQVSLVKKQFSQHFPKPGWVEHDPLEIWESQLYVAQEALKKAGIKAEEVAGIGITNQRETTIIWDKGTGKPVYNGIVWQCRRSADYCDRLIADGKEEMVRSKTGLPIDPYFSATKISWILDNVEGARNRAENGELLFGTVDTWLIWNLTGGKCHATDYSNASRTMLFNIHTGQWDDELLEMLAIPESMLPEVKPSSGFFGNTEVSLFDGEIQVCAAIGDQQSALFGHVCTNHGDVKNTYGTGCFLLMNTGSETIQSEHGLATTIAWGLNGNITYALEGSVFMAGATVEWLINGLQAVSGPAEADKAAESVDDSGGVYFVPAFTGLGAPHWRPEARGVITGLTRGTDKNHIIRAALEGIAFQVYDIVKAMESDLGRKISSLHVDGGVSNSDFLMQFQSDILRSILEKPADIETTAKGAAFMAGLAAGLWKNEDELRELIRKGDKKFSPIADEAKTSELVRGWKEAVAKA